jgi:hypothetical protein
MDLILHHAILLITIGGLLFLPGILALRLLFGKRSPLSSWETLLTSFALSVGLIDFLMILLGKNHIPLSPLSITAGLIVSLLAFFLLARISRAKEKSAPTKSTGDTASAFHCTPTQGMLFLLIIALTIFTKSIYLSDAAFPTSTDLGHHSYWAKLITETERLPDYSERKIMVLPDGKESLSAPQPIADFIIGEHLPLAAIALFSKSAFVSAFPVIVLFLVNMLSLLACFALAVRFGEEIRTKFKDFLPIHFGLIVLFLLGPIYALATPQAKFVSGGVVGNTFGNLFIPLILLFFLRSVREKNPIFLGISFFLTFTLAYTHHLSTLVLLFILIASILTTIVLQRKSLRSLFVSWFHLLRHPFPIVTSAACTLFFFVVALPTYIETHAIGTAIGTPTKLTRTGLAFSEILSGSGSARGSLGIAGLLLMFFFARSFKNTAGILIGWTMILLVMSLWPSLVFLDIPSNRIGSYALFPLTLMAGFALLLIPEFLKKTSRSLAVPLPLLSVSIFTLILFAYLVGNGSADNGGTLLTATKADDAVQTFAASQFLAERISSDDIVLKDHNYLSADSFMKLFFMRGYGFPLSRGYFKRYETEGHEQCSLTMIATPNTPAGERCFRETGTDIVMINPLFDRSQFEKSPSFSRIYSSPLIQAYRKNP